MAKKKNTLNDLDAFLKAQNTEHSDQAIVSQDNNKEEFLSKRPISLVQEEGETKPIFDKKLESHTEIVGSYKELLQTIIDFAEKRKLSPEIVLLNLTELIEKESGKNLPAANEMPSLIEYIENNASSLLKYFLK
jgi:hypothetical protein